MGHIDFATGKLTITDKIYNLMLTRIADGVYAEGEKLPSESEFCKLFGASKTSVRSALQRLEAIGIIETFHGKGSFVKPRPIKDTISRMTEDAIPMQAYEEFWQFRQALGDKALELFALQASDEDFEALEHLIDLMIDAADSQELAKLSTDFHMYIYRHCGNRFIADAFSENSEMLLKSFKAVQGVRKQSKASLVRWHSSMISILKAGDAQSISATISEENVLFFRDSEN